MTKLGLTASTFKLAGSFITGTFHINEVNEHDD